MLGSQQFIVRLIDGAGCHCPQVNMVSWGACWTQCQDYEKLFWYLHNTTAAATIRAGDTRTRVTPGLPRPRDTLLSNNDAGNIVSQLFVCRAFRTNKSFGRSRSPSEELFESMNYILCLLWAPAKTRKLSIFVEVNDDAWEMICLLIYTVSGYFLNNWWNVKLQCHGLDPLKHSHNSNCWPQFYEPLNWPEKLLFTLLPSPGPQQEPLFQVDWCALSLWTDPLNPRPWPLYPPSPLRGNILVKQTSTKPRDQSVSRLLWLNRHYQCPHHHHYHDHHPPSPVWSWHSCGFI